MRILRKDRLDVIALLIVAAAVGAVWVAFPHFERWAVGVHQKSVTRSIASWGVEDARVTNDASAIHAAGMVGYISRYYVPGPGYRGPVQVEAALEKERRASIARLVIALERYTGLDYGTNVELWTEWAEKREVDETKRRANGSQPTFQETNRTSPTPDSPP